MREEGDLGPVVQAELAEDVETWALTVATLMCSAAASSAFDLPCAMPRATSRSRPLSVASAARGALPGAVVGRDHVDEAPGYARGQDRRRRRRPGGPRRRSAPAECP